LKHGKVHIFGHYCGVIGYIGGLAVRQLKSAKNLASRALEAQKANQTETAALHEATAAKNHIAAALYILCGIALIGTVLGVAILDDISNAISYVGNRIR
jgi:hypothetical protein